jgi:hypothetical protein
MQAAARISCAPPPMSLLLCHSLYISPPFSMLESRVWHRFLCLGRPFDAYPTKSTPWCSRHTPYRLQPRCYRPPGLPSTTMTWRRLGDALKTKIMAVDMEGKTWMTIPMPPNNECGFIHQAQGHLCLINVDENDGFKLSIWTLEHLALVWRQAYSV